MLIKVYLACLNYSNYLNKMEPHVIAISNLIRFISLCLHLIKTENTKMFLDVVVPRIGGIMLTTLSLPLDDYIDFYHKDSEVLLGALTPRNQNRTIGKLNLVKLGAAFKKEVENSLSFIRDLAKFLTFSNVDYQFRVNAVRDEAYCIGEMTLDYKVSSLTNGVELLKAQISDNIKANGTLTIQPSDRILNALYEFYINKAAFDPAVLKTLSAVTVYYNHSIESSFIPEYTPEG